MRLEYGKEETREKIDSPIGERGRGTIKREGGCSKVARYSKVVFLMHKGVERKYVQEWCITKRAMWVLGPPIYSPLVCIVPHARQ